MAECAMLWEVYLICAEWLMRCPEWAVAWAMRDVDWALDNYHAACESELRSRVPHLC